MNTTQRLSQDGLKMKTRLNEWLRFSCLALSLTAAAGSFVACAKDQNSLDYRNRQFADQLAVLQGASGSYSGLVLARDGGLAPAGSPIGAMKVTLVAQGQVLNNADGTPAQSTPTLIATIEFQGNSHLTVNAQSSSFDPATGLLQSDIKVTQAQGDPQTITLAGILNGQTLKGSIEVNGYPQYGGTLLLQKNGASLASLKPANPVDSITGISAGYVGNTVFTSGTTKPVQVILETPSTTPEEGFLELFSPVKPVNVTFNYGNAAQIPYQNGYWFQNDGQVTGQVGLCRNADSAWISGTNGQTGCSNVSQSAQDTQSIQISITCQQDPSTNGLKCNHIQSNNAQVVAVTTVRPVHGNETNTPDDPSTRDEVIGNFKGTGNYNGQVVATNATALYPARTRLVELFELFASDQVRTIQFTFQVGEVPVSFQNVRWDVLNGTLDGQQSFTSNGINSNATIACRNFQIAKEYDFTCIYNNSSQSYSVNLEFKSSGTPTTPVKKPGSKPKK